MSEHIIGHTRQARGRCGPINPAGSLIILLRHPSLMGGDLGGACQHVVDTRAYNGKEISAESIAIHRLCFLCMFLCLSLPWTYGQCGGGMGATWTRGTPAQSRQGRTPSRDKCTTPVLQILYTSQNHRCTVPLHKVHLLMRVWVSAAYWDKWQVGQFADGQSAGQI